MADDIALNAGDSAGATVATDEIGGIHYQWAKLAFGPDNTATKVTASVGLPVDLKASVTLTVNAHAVTNAGTFAVQSTLQAGTAEIGKLAAGVAEIGNVKNSGTFAVQSTLQAGTAAFGKLAANSGVDIGDVDVTSLVPGTGATNSGKAIDSAVGATDTGFAMLMKYSADTVHTAVADGDYDVPRGSDFGAMHVAPEQHHIIDEMDVTTGWAALNNDTTTLATTAKHVLGLAALSFNKVDGAGDTVFGAIAKTITTIDIGSPSPHDIIQTVVYFPSVAAIDYAFVRLGTDSSNYNEWRIDGNDLTPAIFETLLFELGDASHAGITGNGWNPSSISYVVVGAAFNSESDTLSGIIFDELSFHTNLHVNASLNSEVTSSVNSANINLQKVGGSATDKGSGNASNGSQRVVIATDDINLAAIKTAVQILDNAISGNEMQVDLVGAVPAGANLIGDVGLSGARTSGGTTLYKNIDVDAKDEVKATAGQVYWIHAMNTTAAPVFLKFYNLAAANVTVGTTVPDMTFLVPANADSDGAGFTLATPNGIEFGTGITIAGTLLVADNDNTALGANALIVNLGFA